MRDGPPSHERTESESESPGGICAPDPAPIAKFTAGFAKNPVNAGYKPRKCTLFLMTEAATHAIQTPSINEYTEETANMNTSDLIEKLVADQGLTKVQSKAIVDSVLKGITDAVVAGDEVSLPGFGKFKVQSRAAREGRNPATGATIKIAASKKVAFQPAKALKDALNG
jgi:DNA-binding protein HU-beta